MKITKSALRSMIREEITRLNEARVEFDAERMRKFAKDDSFLQHVFKTMNVPNEEKRLEVMFNSFVIGDSGMERAYNKYK